MQPSYHLGFLVFYCILQPNTVWTNVKLMLTRLNIFLEWMNTDTCVDCVANLDCFTWSPTRPAVQMWGGPCDHVVFWTTYSSTHLKHLSWSFLTSYFSLRAGDSSPEWDFSGTSGRSFFNFRTNVQLDSRMSRLDSGGQRSHKTAKWRMNNTTMCYQYTVFAFRGS